MASRLSVLLAGDSSTIRHGGGCAAPLTCTVMNSASPHHFAGRDRLQAGQWPQLPPNQHFTPDGLERTFRGGHLRGSASNHRW